MDNQDNHCSICKKQSQELLVLACQHDPCISCVAKQYFNEAKVQNDFQLNQNANEYYICYLCYEETKLDQSTISQLKKYMKRKINNTRSPIKINSPLYESGKKSSSCNKYSYNYSTAHQTKTPREGSTNSSHHNSPNIVKFQELRTSKISDILDPTDKREEYYSFKQHIPKTPKQILSLCKKHEGEQKTFYCFSCFRDICAECAIHGSHFGHQVQAIKKAANRLRKIYGEVLSEAQRYDNILILQFKQINGIIQGFKEWNTKQRTNIKQMFKELYERLQEKQYKLQRQIDEVERQGLSVIENSKVSYEKLSSELKNKRRTFMNVLNVEPAQWDIQTLEYEKQSINQLLNEKINIAQSKKQRNGLKYLSSDIILEAIETIEELVSTFQLAVVKN